MSVLEQLMSQLGGDNLKQISSALGTDEKTTENAMGAALPTLLAALSRNASKPEGAAALHNALEQDHDGSMLDNLAGLLGGGGGGRGGDGAGILKHVLGGRQQVVQSGVSKASGMKPDSTNKLMEMLAPAVMGALGKEQRKSGLDANALAGFLSGQEKEVEKRAPQGSGLANQLLDADNDGDVDMSDWIKHGTKMVGKLFSK